MGHEIEDDAVARIARDPDAFEVFYRRNVETVQRFIARRVSDPHVAADLTADVFLAAIESASRYRSSRGAPIAWLYGIAHHTLAARRRLDAREVRAMSALSGRALLAYDDVTRIEARLDAEARARDLHGAMNGLRASERAVLELVALDGLSVSEAASALRISAVAARVRLHRARRAMRAALDSEPAPRRTEAR